ncbi:MAG: flavin reductase (DIM6/NTAB) family NADH-FMN oxidoreductase RutF [Gammaproteobacteria bacterium]|jgi:flavin reductase (DIM6/NTAB) family NADH-FMN oxidoreductase RutF
MSNADDKPADNDRPMSKPLDSGDLRRAFGSFATGVTIVTTVDKTGEVYGFTANSFTSVSLNPPLLLVNIAKSAYGLEVFTDADGFAINVLAENQKSLSNTFASQGADKFHAVDWARKSTGSPIFDGVIGWFDCASYQQVDAGDHVILIGQVLDYGYNVDSPLGFCRGAYVSFGLSAQMLQLVSGAGQLKVGALIEHDGQILLQTDEATGEVKIPVSDSIGDVGRGEGLLGGLASIGIEAQLPFLFSAYHDGLTRHVYYRSEILSTRDVVETASLRFYRYDDIPWDAITDSAITGMLKRFISEHPLGNFAVYIGDDDQGAVYRHHKKD